jgi:hypothetical protein
MFLIEYGGGFRNVKPAFCKAIGGMIEQRKQCFFKKKRAKNFASGGIWRGTPPSPRESKVFCFFFSKKKRFLPPALRAYTRRPGRFRLAF